MSNVVSVNKGSDTTILFEWKDSAGSPIVIASPSVFDVSPQISDRFSVEEVDYSIGKVNIVFEGTDPVQVGAYFFRVQVTDTNDFTWTNPTNAYAGDVNIATSPSAQEPTWLQFESTDRIVFHGFGFDTFTIPVGATLTGIELQIEWEDSFVPFPLEYALRLHESATFLGGVGAQKDFQDGATTRTLGGSSDMWSTSLTDSDVRDSGFGVSLQCTQNLVTDCPGQARVNYLKTRIHYDY